MSRYPAKRLHLDQTIGRHRSSGANVLFFVILCISLLQIIENTIAIFGMAPLVGAGMV